MTLVKLINFAGGVRKTY